MTEKKKYYITICQRGRQPNSQVPFRIIEEEGAEYVPPMDESKSVQGERCISMRMRATEKQRERIGKRIAKALPNLEDLWIEEMKGAHAEE
jgi:hypothetical protein